MSSKIEVDTKLKIDILCYDIFIDPKNAQLPTPSIKFE
jgi:hypothetical protein